MGWNPRSSSFSFLRTSPSLKSVQLFLGLFMCLGFLAFSIGHPSVFSFFRVSFFDLSRPVLFSLSEPLRETKKFFHTLWAYSHLYQKYQELWQENQKLKTWKDQANVLALENNKLRAYLQLVPKISQTYVTTEVLGDFHGHYLKTFVIAGGKEEGFHPQQMVVVRKQVIGQILEVGNRTSTVLLSTDFNSRIPIESVGADVQGILAGYDGSMLRLMHRQGTGILKQGDDLYTTGTGGVFQKGFKVGSVCRIQGEEILVTPDLNWESLHYVQVIQ